MSLLFIFCVLRGHKPHPGTDGWQPVKRAVPGGFIWLCCCSRCGLAYWEGKP